MIKGKQTGRYEYHSNDNPNAKSLGHSNDRIFERYVEENESFLRDVQVNQYYTFQ